MAFPFFPSKFKIRVGISFSIFNSMDLAGSGCSNPFLRTLYSQSHAVWDRTLDVILRCFSVYDPSRHFCCFASILIPSRYTTTLVRLDTKTLRLTPCSGSISTTMRTLSTLIRIWDSSSRQMLHIPDETIGGHH